MGEAIEIKDRTGKTVLKFFDFGVRSSIRESDQIFIWFKLWLSIGSTTSTYELEGELSDFEMMLNHLEVLNRDLKRTFYFQDSDERVRIKFTPNDAGIVKVEGVAAEIDYSSKIEFKFETDQTFLKDLIDRCKIVIDQMRVESLN